MADSALIVGNVGRPAFGRSRVIALVKLKVWSDRSPILQWPAILGAIVVEYEMC
jgi:hypothetical protein